MCAIANDGKAVSFNIIDRFENASGKAVDVGYTSSETQVLSSDIAAQMKSLMRNNVKSAVRREPV